MDCSLFAVPVFAAADGDFLAAGAAGFFAGGVWLGAADVCATAFPSSTTPAANMVLTTIKSFLMALLSHCSKNSANRNGQPLRLGRHHYGLCDFDGPRRQKFLLRRRPFACCF